LPAGLVFRRTLILTIDPLDDMITDIRPFYQTVFHLSEPDVDWLRVNKNKLGRLHRSWQAIRHVEYLATAAIEVS
jgi:hypothetical protein